MSFGDLEELKERAAKEEDDLWGVDILADETSHWPTAKAATPRYVFPRSRTWWALGTPKASRDWKKDCGEPGARMTIGARLARGDAVIE